MPINILNNKEIKKCNFLFQVVIIGFIQESAKRKEKEEKEPKEKKEESNAKKDESTKEGRDNSLSPPHVPEDITGNKSLKFCIDVNDVCPIISFFSTIYF